MTITLTFSSYASECTYDYLFVYDGLSYMSKLLGSFSGNNIPEAVVASSGKVSCMRSSSTKPRDEYLLDKCHYYSASGKVQEKLEKSALWSIEVQFLPKSVKKCNFGPKVQNYGLWQNS